ncbi:MAG TPA: hypothetical protein VHG51_06335 [Longimicrobiaceae bacterium]|nr:hypothetical protein [Longimicrobiaceae bacterium]
MTGLRLLAALALAGCAASAPGGGAPGGAEPCPEGVAPAGAEWRLVRAEGFTFCVPRAWRPMGEPAGPGLDPAAWSGDGGTGAWGAGPYRAREAGPVRVEVREGERRAAGEVRRFSESIGGASADLWDDRIGDRRFTGAQWTRPRPVHLAGEASGARGAALQLDVYRTVRFERR